MPPAARSLARLFGGERSAFVAVSLTVNLIFCLRSYITMQALDYRELGLAALLQSIVLLVGMVQFGFLNGGYRLMCSADEEGSAKINNLVFTFIGLLTITIAVVLLGALPFLGRDGSALVTGLGAFGGVMTLVRTWMMNHMIARGNLARLNQVNLSSAIASLLPLGLIPFDPLSACLLSVVAQPVAFVVAAAVGDRRLLPNAIERSESLVRAVLAAGFTMFLIGMFLQVNLQIERWYVTAFLGLDALGHLYLALLFATLFQMIPTSLDQVFLPAAVRAHVADDLPTMRRGLGQFFVVQLIYCGLAILAVGVLARPLTALILPQYVADLKYLYLMVPGLILFTISGPFSIVFNVLIRYRTYFVAYGAGTILTAVVLLIGSLTHGSLSLVEVMILRSIVYALMGAILIAGFYVITKDCRGLRFWLRPEQT